VSTPGPAVTRGPRRAQERLRRLLVMLPWLMERGQASVAEMAARFGLSEAHLVEDLELASLCGLPPYVDELVDVWIEDGVVRVGVPRLFTRPLRLTATEGFALLAAGRAALALPGADPDGPLGRALDKLAAALGEADPVLAVDLDRPPLLDVVREAVEGRRRLEVRYYSAWRDELTERTIDPQAVFAERGQWYVVADDSRAGAERRFRVDRIERAEATGEGFEHRDVAVPIGAWFEDGAGATMATLRLPATAAWVAETYPVADANRQPDGSLVVRLPVAGERWLERLLVRAGPEAAVLAPPEWADLGRAAAARLLARYRAAEAGGGS
jgi:proteasome accessory factor C